LAFLAYDDPSLERPRKRSDCVGGPRPCPWISCRHHLGLEDLAETGRLQALGITIPANATPEQLDALTDEIAERLASMSPSCALDVAATENCDEKTLQAVADTLRVTRERIRQLELTGLRRARAPTAAARSHARFRA